MRPLKQSEKWKLYEWMDAHKEDHVAEYPKILEVDRVDYDTLRQAMYKRGYVAWELVNPDRKDRIKQMRIFIK